ncbi:hypothetical protein LCGC14_0858160 [marine sediment metagenome]|uniref:Uncharacterized protein n=1 Tax=marine sediment metagenome TaxID=412755 RepID=A0A0F9P851_9ZZZZ
MPGRARYSPKIKEPVFKSMTMGKWKLRLATAADVSAGAARTVGDWIKEHNVDGVYDVDEADV